MLDQQMVDFHMGNREIHVFFNKRAIFGGKFLENWNIFLESYISETWKDADYESHMLEPWWEKMKKHVGGRPINHHYIIYDILC